ncbi:flagellar hook assembly protein FlgD [Tianweitania sediminis]|jgi:flagellar basal-body rod modification protein FlgD|uniref:Basal-body rod modification protein FlgD n=1 Tax=Tianweitania sediminis TaxID=1502156 RepID=A0A8J7ULY6_9HYPH|nr:flagellar hook assembly protein FlgD [Tianweitania sediminis]MBP0441254.1 flagellar hook assembly protein FlgD [Tianweitania sediminis]HEV7417851.1 flagellar hook assembly protein FlgD [Tianweitania sediminis]
MTLAITPQLPPADAVIPTAENKGATKANVDYQSFLKLLVAEMKHQDPTNPMDSTQYVSQLANFSQVEQAIQTNTKLTQIMQASSLAQADTIIGRTVTSPDGGVSGVVTEVKLGATNITAVLKDGSEVVIGPGVTVK